MGKYCLFAIYYKPCRGSLSWLYCIYIKINMVFILIQSRTYTADWDRKFFPLSSHLVHMHFGITASQHHRLAIIPISSCCRLYNQVLSFCQWSYGVCQIDSGLKRYLVWKKTWDRPPVLHLSCQQLANHISSAVAISWGCFFFSSDMTEIPTTNPSAFG